MRHPGHARERRALELRAQAAVCRRLPGRLALGDLRLDRARRGLRAGNPRTRCASRGRADQPGALVSRSFYSTRTGTRSLTPVPIILASCMYVQPASSTSTTSRRTATRRPGTATPHRGGHRLLGRRGLSLHLRPQDRHDHLRWHEHLPGRDRGGAGAAPGDLRRRGLRYPVGGMGRDRARNRGARAGLGCLRRRSRRSARSTWPATRCHAPSTSSMSCRGPARARSSSGSCGRRTGPGGRHRSADRAGQRFRPAVPGASGSGARRRAGLIPNRSRWPCGAPRSPILPR